MLAPKAILTTTNQLEPPPEPPPRVLTILSYVLEKLVARSDRLVAAAAGGSARLGRSLGTFDGARAPNISIGKYLERLYKYTNCSPSCFVVGYVYIDRLLHRHPDSLVVSVNVHRLIVTCVMVAAKILDDDHYNNSFYARVGGITNAELNKLELELLSLLDYGVSVTSSVFENYCVHLEREMLLNGATHKIERPLLSNGVSEETEISIEDTQSSSPSQLAE